MRTTLSLITAGILLFCTACHAADVPTIHTLGDLQNVVSTDIGRGWVVRYALADSGAQAGPWLLLYCLAEFHGADLHPALALNESPDRQIVGPLAYRFVPEDANLLVKQSQHLALQMRPLEARRALFCAALPTSFAGTYHLEIFSPTGAVLARKQLVVKEPRACYWHQFATTRNNGRGSSFATDLHPSAARPIYTGVRNILPDRFVPQQAAPSDGGAALPGAIPLAGGWEIPYLPGPKAPSQYPLALAREGLTLTVTSATGMMSNWPDYFFIARWWVNGKPIVARRPSDITLSLMGTAISATPTVTVSLGLPDVLGTLKVGDKVRLQLLYCPEGSEPMPAHHLSHTVDISTRDSQRTLPVPLLTNPLEIEVTQMMLNGRQ